jgi:hypothetical protein
MKRIFQLGVNGDHIFLRLNLPLNDSANANKNLIYKSVSDDHVFIAGYWDDLIANPEN